MTGIQPPPERSYYAVIFTSLRTDGDSGYDDMAGHMEALAHSQPGCLGSESFRDDDGRGVTISYWRSLADIETWRKDPQHMAAKQQGRERWYSQYCIRICQVIGEHRFQ